MAYSFAGLRNAHALPPPALPGLFSIGVSPPPPPYFLYISGRGLQQFVYVRRLRLVGRRFDPLAKTDVVGRVASGQIAFVRDGANHMPSNEVLEVEQKVDVVQKAVVPRLRNAKLDSSKADDAGHRVVKCNRVAVKKAVLDGIHGLPVPAFLRQRMVVDAELSLQPCRHVAVGKVRPELSGFQEWRMRRPGGGEFRISLVECLQLRRRGRAHGSV